MELRPFGSGHRKPLAAPGAHAVEEREIHRDARGLVAELAFGRHACVAVAASPRTTVLVVIEGGGLIEVGDEPAEPAADSAEAPQRFRIANGQSIYLEAGTSYRIVTEASEMRAILVELAGPPQLEAAADVVEGAPAPPSDEPPSGGRAEGSVRLIPRAPARPPHVESGEPW